MHLLLCTMAKVPGSCPNSLRQKVVIVSIAAASTTSSSPLRRTVGTMCSLLLALSRCIDSFPLCDLPA